MSEARPWSNTPSCMADGMAVVLVIGEGSEGIYQLPKEIDVRSAHQLPGKPAEEHTPHGAFDQLSQWRCSDTKIRATSSRARVGTQAFTDQAQ